MSTLNGNTYITNTTDNGKLYLGISNFSDDVSKTLGTGIDIYKNSIFAFFARIFNFASKIEVNGKHYTVNNKSFNEHLRSIDMIYANINIVRGMGYKNFIHENRENIKESEKNLAENISDEKRTKLFVKLIHEIKNNRTENIINLVNKGAYLDRKFYEVKLGKTTYYCCSDKALAKLISNFNKIDFSILSPIRMASEQKNDDIVHFMLDFMAKDKITDNKDLVRLKGSEMEKIEQNQIEFSK
ncbi:MAG: hypothetical protein Q8K60_02740 [Parachlamydiaceae bacterium]|nr:hypothetical protein [Parachlamydiaceae bacterium]